MALFSLKKIAALATSRQSYLRGIALYNAGRVKNAVADYTAFYTEFLTAEVEDADTVYDIEVGMNSDGAAEYLYCSCDAFREGAGACKHIVGALTDKYYRDMLGAVTPASALMTPAIQTDDVAKRLMQISFRRDKTRLRSVGDTACVSLIPTVSVASGRVLLSLAVNHDKKYVIKDISRFFDAMKNGETLSYGKSFSFVHTPDAIEQSSRPLYELMCAELDAYTHAHRTPPTGRDFPLSPGGVDRLLALYVGRTLQLRMDDKVHTLPVQTSTPAPAITVEKSDGGYRFVTDRCVPFFGTNALYLAWGGAIFVTPPAFCERAEDWLRVSDTQKGGITVATADMPAFCAKVICRVQKALKFVGDDSWRQYMPLRPETKVYLDAPEDGTLTAGVQFCYGEKIIPLFTDAPPADRRDIYQELQVQLLIERYFSGYRPETGEVVLHGDDDAVYTFLTEGLPQLENLANIYASDAFRKLRPVTPNKIAVGVTVNSGLLELDIDTDKWQADDLSAMLSAFREGKKFSRLKSGAYVQLDTDAVQSLSLLSEELALTPAMLKSGKITLPQYRAWQILSILQNRPSVRFTQAQVFRELVNTLQQARENPLPIPPEVEHILRPYQKEGFYWLKTLDTAGFGGILADDMGLGKTLQMIALLLDCPSTLPSLVVCPASLVLNWVSEINKFAPSLSVLPIMGDAATREKLLSQCHNYRVVVTSYDLLKRDIALYKDLQFYYHILDEAQYIKNQKTLSARAVKAIFSQRRFALTGTPIENKLSELWSIFDFLMPSFLYSYPYFKRHIELPAVRDGEMAPLARLSRAVSPFLLRRLKSDVLSELPPKTEQVLVCPLTEQQEKQYTACAMQVKDSLSAAMANGTFEKQKLSILTLLMRLRQLCCEPSLCVDGYHGESGKRQMCLDLIQNAVENGHRILLFSQFTSMLDILQRDLDERGISHMTLRGSTPAADRGRLVEEFNTGDTAVFLISLKAGGTGLNLTGADVVIHYDPWWNVAAEQQATDRAYRIGQTRPVQVLRLVTKGTVEENILRMQQQKQDLANAVLSASLTSFSALSAEELLSLI